MTDEENVFSRWSRRKRAAPERTVQPVPDAEAPVEIVEPETEKEEADLLKQLGLPKPESLGEGDDFAPFMQAGVPEFLRKRALRVLWRSNPVLANLDGLNDYDDDFNAPELTQKVLATGYQVGRGFVKKVVEALEDEEAEERPSEAGDPVEVAGEENNSKTLAEAPQPTQSREPETDDTARPRRMRFRT